MTVIDIARAARAAGFEGASLIRAIAIAGAESGFDASAVHDTRAFAWDAEANAYVKPETGEALPPGTQPEYSAGAWQINLLAHPDVPEADALDLARAASWAYVISDVGRDFTPWSTNAGLAPGLLELAAQAVQTLTNELPTAPHAPPAVYLSQDQGVSALTWAAVAVEAADDVWLQWSPSADMITVAVTMPRGQLAVSWPALVHIDLDPPAL